MSISEQFYVFTVVCRCIPLGVFQTFEQAYNRILEVSEAPYLIDIDPQTYVHSISYMEVDVHNPQIYNIFINLLSVHDTIPVIKSRYPEV